METPLSSMMTSRCSAKKKNQGPCRLLWLLASPIPWASCARSWATSSPSLLSHPGSWVSDPMIQWSSLQRVLPKSSMHIDMHMSVMSVKWLLSPKTPHSSRRSCSSRSNTFRLRYQHCEKGEIKAFKAGRATTWTKQKAPKAKKDGDTPGTSSRYSSSRLNMS